MDIEQRYPCPIRNIIDARDRFSGLAVFAVCTKTTLFEDVKIVIILTDIFVENVKAFRKEKVE